VRQRVQGLTVRSELPLPVGVALQLELQEVGPEAGVPTGAGPVEGGTAERVDRAVAVVPPAAVVAAPVVTTAHVVVADRGHRARWLVPVRAVAPVTVLLGRSTALAGDDREEAVDDGDRRRTGKVVDGSALPARAEVDLGDLPCVGLGDVGGAALDVEPERAVQPVGEDADRARAVARAAAAVVVTTPVVPTVLGVLGTTVLVVVRALVVPLVVAVVVAL